MSDLISKQVLLYALDYKKFIDGESIDINELKSLIKRIPTIEPEPIKHGKWLRTEAYPHRIYCSECYATFIRNDEFLKLNDIPHNYCPNCGAKLDEVEE